MSVEQNLEQILSARYGKDVRQSIHDAIYDINEVAKDAEYHASTAPTSAQAYANAALAAEQAAQQAKQDAEAAAEQAMSGTPSGYDQVVAEVRSLETNEDTVLAQAGTFVGRVLLEKMYGMSIQDGTPTPSVPVAIKSAKANFNNCGKNLVPNNATSETYGNVTITVNYDKSIRLNGETTAEYTIDLFNDSSHPIKLNEACILTDGGGCTSNMLLVATINSVNYQCNGSNHSVNLPSGNLTRLKIYYNNTYNADRTVYPMIRLATVSDDTYEPYQGQSVTTDLVLRAIEVTSSDAYNLVKDGKYYIADTLEKIDGGYQITRRCDVVTLDGTENMTWVAEAERDGSKILYAPIASFSKFNNKEPKVVSSNKIAPAISNRYTAQSGNTLAQTATIGFGFYIATNNYLSFRTPGITTSSDFKTWLTSNNVDIVYVRATPTTEFISTSDAKKLLSLKSYDEATYVAQTEDTEGVMVLKYGSTELSNMAVTGYVEGEQNSIRLSDLESAV